MTCRTCKYLRVSPNAAGKIVPRKGYAYYCTFPLPDLTRQFPASMEFNQRSVRRSYMEPDDGANCTKHEARK